MFMKSMHSAGVMASASAASPTLTDAYLHVSRLCKSYDGVHRVVDDVNLEIRRGEFVTFLGPSGSGKTTTLSMIAGFETPTAGDIRVNGRSLVQIPVHQRNIGLVFQSYALFPHMTAAQNVAFPLRMRKVNTADQVRRAQRALDIVGLGQHGARMPSQLSGGQQQRVALARALVFEPDVLLLDEPLSALDKNLRVQMQIEIKRLHTELGMTTVFVTHDQGEAMTMSDRIAVFNAGRVEQFAAPLDLYGAPCTRFVGEFIGESNFIEVSVVDAAKGEYASPALGRVRAATCEKIAGSTVSLLLRPEWIRLGTGGGTACSAGVKDAQLEVTNVIHYGDSALVIGHSAGLPLRVKVPNIDMQGVTVGSRHPIHWDPVHTHVLSD